MARFTKYNNPNRRRRTGRKSQYSKAYIEERKNELYQLIAEAETDEQKRMLIDAFNVSIRP